jgi:trk system potassium uptake protein TrkA
MLVIGLGRFGSNLSIKLMELGNEVMAVDKDEQRVNKIAPSVTASRIADCMDIEVLRTIGAKNFDVCFVCISNNFQSSLEITSLLKELGAPKVVSKADHELHSKFLLKVGADETVYPERDMALRTAVKYSSNGTMEYLELTADYGIFEFVVPGKWDGRSIRHLNIRDKYGVNIIGSKKNDTIIPISEPDTRLSAGDHLLVAGSKQTMALMLEKF